MISWRDRSPFSLTRGRATSEVWSEMSFLLRYRHFLIPTTKASMMTDGGQFILVYESTVFLKEQIVVANVKPGAATFGGKEQKLFYFQPLPVP